MPVSSLRIIHHYDLESVDLAISPNPNCFGVLNINTSDSKDFDLIKIYNYTGKLVLEKDYNSEIDISKLIPGSYIVKFLDDTQVVDVQKLQVI